MSDLDPSDPDSDPDSAPAGCRSAPDEVWADVRRDYLTGLSAPACCRRYGVGLSALRERAAREGWRRMDQDWSPPNRLDPEDEGMKMEERVGGDLDKVEMCELSFIAHRRMMRAVMRGDAAEALRWRRVRFAMDQEEAEMDRLIAQQESLRHYHGEPDGPDGPDDPDGVSGPGSSPPGRGGSGPAA